MKLLLDTHIWLWSLLDPERLPARITKELSRSTNELWLSPITVWEILLLDAGKRINVTAPAEEWISRMLLASPTIDAPLTREVALETGRITLPHRDPADTFLAATANVFGLTLVTADTKLIEAKACEILAAR